MLKHCVTNRKRQLSALPNVGPYIYIYSLLIGRTPVYTSVFLHLFIGHPRFLFPPAFCHVPSSLIHLLSFVICAGCIPFFFSVPKRLYSGSHGSRILYLYILHDKISGFTRSSIYIYIYDISRLRVKHLCVCNCM
jgi:hypothetical protein